MHLERFITRIETQEAVIGVVGLGYVGLPLIMECCRKGFKVIGFDHDHDKISALNRNESYIHYIDPQEIASFTEKKVLEATTDFSRVAEVDAILLCVPTPLNEHQEPDLSYITTAGHDITPHLHSGQLVILESTTYPGTTNDVLRKIIESTGLIVGQDIGLAYSPEREDPGNPVYSTSKLPKVIGGVDEDSLKAADALYRQLVVSTVPVSNTETAEAVKLLENVFRSVNIALVNELKQVYSAMDIDIWEVIEAAKTKPFGYMPFYPGPGLGGHCIPIDPFYLAWKAKQLGVPTRFIELAGEINTVMPDYVIGKLEEAIIKCNKNLEQAHVLILGAAYKQDVADPRESPGIAMLEKLHARGVNVSYNDPFIPILPEQENHDLHLHSVELTADILESCDAVLIATAHSDYDFSFIVNHAPLVIDTRNATRGLDDPNNKIVKA